MKIPAVSTALLMALSLTGVGAFNPQDDSNDSIEKRDPPNRGPGGGPNHGMPPNNGVPPNDGSAPSWWGKDANPTNGGPNSWGHGDGGPGGDGGWGKGGGGGPPGGGPPNGGPPGGGDHQWTGRPSGSGAPWAGRPTGKPSKRDEGSTDTDGNNDGQDAGPGNVVPKEEPTGTSPYFDIPTNIEPTGEPLKVNIPEGLVSDADGNPMICGCWHVRADANGTNTTDSSPPTTEGGGETHAPGAKVKRIYTFNWWESQLGGKWGGYMEFGSGTPDNPMYDVKRFGAISRLGWKNKRDDIADNTKKPGVKFKSTHYRARARGVDEDPEDES